MMRRMTADEFDEVYDTILDAMDADGRLMTLMIPGPNGVHVVQSHIPLKALQYAYDPDQRGREEFHCQAMVATCREFGLPTGAEDA
jgi:hypothetical protein